MYHVTLSRSTDLDYDRTALIIHFRSSTDGNATQARFSYFMANAVSRYYRLNQFTQVSKVAEKCRIAGYTLLGLPRRFSPSVPRNTTPLPAVGGALSRSSLLLLKAGLSRTGNILGFLDRWWEAEENVIVLIP